MRWQLIIITIFFLVTGCATAPIHKKVVVSYDSPEESGINRIKVIEDEVEKESYGFSLSSSVSEGEITRGIKTKIKDLAPNLSNERLLIEVRGRYLPDMKGNTYLFIDSLDPADPINVRIFNRSDSQLKVEFFNISLTEGGDFVKLEFDRLPPILDNDKTYDLEVRLLSRTSENLNDKRVKIAIMIMTSVCNQNECSNTEFKNFLLDAKIKYDKPFIVAPKQVIFSIPYGTTEWQSISLCNAGTQEAQIDINLWSFNKGAFALNPPESRGIKLFSNQCFPMEVGFSANNAKSVGYIIVDEKSTRKYFIYLEGRSEGGSDSANKK